MHDDYFEAIVQLRNPTDDSVIYARKLLRDQISKQRRVRGGVDFYVKDKKRAENAARKIRDKYGGEFNIAAKLHGRDHLKSKDLYRLNILIRLPNFTIRDVIQIKNDIFSVVKLGKKVTGRNLKTWKTKEFNYPELYELLKRSDTRVCKVHPRIEVLHPDTYQPEPLENKPRKEIQMDEKVKVVESKGLWICYPL